MQSKSRQTSRNSSIKSKKLKVKHNGLKKQEIKQYNPHGQDIDISGGDFSSVAKSQDTETIIAVGDSGNFLSSPTGTGNVSK